MSLLLALQTLTVSLAVASSTESASAETLAERYSLTTASATEDSSASTLTERVSFAVASATETASAATVAERVSAAVGSSTETASAQTLAERVSLAAASATETSTAASAAGRIAAAVASASETSAAGTIAERMSAAVASATETATAATMAERLIVAVSASTEMASAATMAERLALSTDSATESSSAATVAERLSSSIESATESASAASLSVVIPAVTFAVASATETSSDVAGSISLPPAPLPAIAALAPGGPGAWYDSTEGLSETTWLDRMGNGYDLAATGTPTVVPDVENGRAVARLDGASFYAVEDSPVGASPTEFSFLVLFQSPVTNPVGRAVAVLAREFEQPDGSEVTIGVAEVGGDEAVYGAIYNPLSGGGSSNVQSDFFAPDALTGNALTLVEVYAEDVASGTMQFLRNGVPQFAVPPVFDPLDLGLLVVGASEYAGNAPYAGDVCLIVALPVTLAIEDRQVVYDWITDVYGLELPTIYTPPVSLSVESSTETGSDLEVAHDSVTEPPPVIGGGILRPRTSKRPGFHVTVTPPPATRAWFVPPVRVLLGDLTTVPEPAGFAWVAPSASVALGDVRVEVAPARRQWVALTPVVLSTPDPDEALLILGLADGFL